MTPSVLYMATPTKERDFTEGLSRKGKSVPPREWEEVKNYIFVFGADPYKTKRDLEAAYKELSATYRDIPENLSAAFAVASGKLGAEGENKPKELEKLYLDTLKDLALGGEKFVARVEGANIPVGHNGAVVLGMGYAVSEVMKSDDLAMQRFLVAINNSPARNSILANEHFMSTMELLASNMKPTGNHVQVKLFERIVRDHFDLLYDGNRTQTGPDLAYSLPALPGLVMAAQLDGN